MHTKFCLSLIYDNKFLTSYIDGRDATRQHIFSNQHGYFPCAFSPRTTILNWTVYSVDSPPSCVLSNSGFSNEDIRSSVNVITLDSICSNAVSGINIKLYTHVHMFT